jgi:hypothetical protein
MKCVQIENFWSTGNRNSIIKEFSSMIGLKGKIKSKYLGIYCYKNKL